MIKLLITILGTSALSLIPSPTQNTTLDKVGTIHFSAVAATQPLPQTSAKAIESLSTVPVLNNLADDACKQYEPAVARYNDWNVSTMLAIMMAESGCNADHINNNPGTGDYSVGLLQINLFGALANSRPSADWLFNPTNNIDYAHKLYERSGYSPWTTYTSGKYLKYKE